ncbi:MAG: Uma2 family endonuclease [Cyanobacteria bacterium P01_D01_bin.1]
MVTTTRRPAPVIQQSDQLSLQPNSLEEWLENPVEGTEWVNGRLIEKNSATEDGMTLAHSKIQRRLSTVWAIYQMTQQLGGEVYTEVPCQTREQGRKPDVAYLTQDLLEQYGGLKVLPQSFPLCAEVVSPTDLAEEVYAKADEYLASGGEEVWIVFPNSQRVVVVTADRDQIFKSGEIAKTQIVLPGFSVAVDELLS